MFRHFGRHWGKSQAAAEKLFSARIRGNVGATIPVKIGLTLRNGSPASNATASLALAPVINGLPGSYQPTTSKGGANADSLFRSTNDGEYLYNLDTSALAPGTWSLQIKLDDGSEFYEQFTLR